jgi:hypothetical protein
VSGEDQGGGIFAADNLLSASLASIIPGVRSIEKIVVQSGLVGSTPRWFGSPLRAFFLGAVYDLANGVFVRLSGNLWY